MALSEEGSGGGIPATMLVGPASVGGGSMPYPYPIFGGMGGGGQNGFGDGGWWIVLLIIVIAALGGNWGGNNSGGGFGGGQPIIVNDGGGSVQRGFDQAAVMAGITGISSNLCSGFGDIQTALCSGFAGVNATVNNGVNTLAQQMYTNQIADMQQNFALQSAFSDCCCKNQLATESLRATVLSENCADRYEAANNTRDIITAITAGIQAVKDELCADRLEGYKREADNLRQQLTMANLAASQTAQTSRILADNAAQTVSLERYLSPTPIPAYIVQNPNCCQQNTGCGCGGNTGGFNGNF